MSALVAVVVRTLVLAGLSWLTSLLDTMSTGAWLRTALVWLAVGVLVGVLAALQTQDFSADLDRDVLISDLTSLTPFIAGLVVVPAALGGLLGRILWESRTR
ncbi:hypothetical protein JNO54_03005 [Janibacter sp. YIM B02568]|uniref:hypothetical protein n=1 Tax=Janibacter endophyticus TaxID=2806261 RepID=UPI001951B5AD|nr:hypothetical protein [Janibacter endophyticus]MBM6545110.1 hypothetical protein [Janibacter endophyticus]